MPLECNTLQHLFEMICVCMCCIMEFGNDHKAHVRHALSCSRHLQDNTEWLVPGNVIISIFDAMSSKNQRAPDDLWERYQVCSRTVLYILQSTSWGGNYLRWWNQNKNLYGFFFRIFAIPVLPLQLVSVLAQHMQTSACTALSDKSAFTCWNERLSMLGPTLGICCCSRSAMASR